MRLFLLPILAASLAQASTMISLRPSGGVVSGIPGQTVGWGFEISDSTDFLVVSATAFCTAFNPSTDLLPCTPVSNGTYLDYYSAAPFNFYESAPGAPDTSQNVFDPVAQTGTGAFTIDNSALVGTTISGVVVIDYNLFTPDCDPNSGTCTPTELTNPANSTTDFFAVMPASVNVVPEPATAGLTGLGLLAIFSAKRAKKRQAALDESRVPGIPKRGATGPSAG